MGQVVLHPVVRQPGARADQDTVVGEGADAAVV